MMKPIKFKEANGVLLGADGVDNLPCYRGESTVVSCWRISFWGRVKIMFTGKAWFNIRGTTHAPMYLDVDSPFE